MLRKVFLLLNVILLFSVACTMGQPMYLQYYNMGVEYVMQGDLRSAEVQFSRAIELNENFADAYAQRGWVKWFSNRPGPALQDYNVAISLKPEVITTKNLRNVFRTIFEDYNGVIDDFDYTITIDTSEYIAYNGKDFVDFVTSDPFEILDEYESELNNDPENYQLMIRKALAEFYVYNYGNAIDLCSRAIGINPNGQWAFFIRGNAYAKINELNKSLKDYYSFERIDNGFPVLYLNRGITNMNLGNRYQAMEDFNAALKLKPDLYEAMYFKGKMLGENGKFDEAIALLSKVIDYNPQDLGALINRGLFYKKINNYIEALADYDAVIKFEIEIAEVYHNRGNLRLMIKDLKGAMEDFNEALSLDENLSKTYFNRGVLKFLMGNPADGCLDMQTSRDLGYEEAIDNVDLYCN
jgi:tetratricopeptide (TPR) repeat protein